MRTIILTVALIVLSCTLWAQIGIKFGGVHEDNPDTTNWISPEDRVCYDTLFQSGPVTISSNVQWEAPSGRIYELVEDSEYVVCGDSILDGYIGTPTIEYISSLKHEWRYHLEWRLVPPDTMKGDKP